eukprot:scaffold97763_cov33-Tisochrysis_lutea.AAC.3
MSHLGAIAEILEVGDGRLDLVGILHCQWHAPQVLARRLGGAEELLAKLVIVGPHAGVGWAEGDDASACAQKGAITRAARRVVGAR